MDSKKSNNNLKKKDGFKSDSIKKDYTKKNTDKYEGVSKANDKKNTGKNEGIGKVYDKKNTGKYEGIGKVYDKKSTGKNEGVGKVYDKKATGKFIALDKEYDKNSSERKDRFNNEYNGKKSVKRDRAEDGFDKKDSFRKTKDNNMKSSGNRQVSKKGRKEPTKNVIGQPCIFRKQCGGCDYQEIPYDKQLVMKKTRLETLLKDYCKVKGMIGMEHPYHYRNKVHAVISHNKQGIISGVYKAGTHIVIPTENCLIEDAKANEIIKTICTLMKSFKMKSYDEDSGYGFVRHILIKRGFTSGEIMVVLVTASSIFPSKNNFVKALLKIHPEITTIIQNVNDKQTSMILGEQEKVMYGKGYIEDTLSGCTFRISSKSFYQVNSIQTEKLYSKALELAKLTGKETLVDAYCGIGTIGLIASPYVKEVIGVELNKDAVRDAISNAKRNNITNANFYQCDAGDFMKQLAEQGKNVDVVMMDPPRSGSTEVFIDSIATLAPQKVVYVSCNPETLARDLAYFKKKGYAAKEAYGVDMFPWTDHVECCVRIERVKCI
jgi:23S rRNA (uracil1939-C5)-methyltransferase